MIGNKILVILLCHVMSCHGIILLFLLHVLENNFNELKMTCIYDSKYNFFLINI